MDWKIVVVRDSSCLRTGSGVAVFSAVRTIVKLFITRRGGDMYSLPPPRGCFCALATSLHSEYFSIWKCRVGPRGVSAMRRFVRFDLEREKRRRCVTPSGPAIEV